MKKIKLMFVKFVVYLTWILLIYSAFLDLSTKTYWRLIIWAALALISIFIYNKNHLKPITQIILNLTIIANILGEVIFEFFYTVSIYDKILHFSIPFLIVFILYDFLRNKIPEKKSRLLYSVYIALGLSFIWEVAEIAFDYFFDAPMIGVFVRDTTQKHFDETIIEIMNPWMDTLYDVILDVIGITLSALTINKVDIRKPKKKPKKKK